MTSHDLKRRKTTTIDSQINSTVSNQDSEERQFDGNFTSALLSFLQALPSPDNSIADEASQSKLKPPSDTEVSEPKLKPESERETEASEPKLKSESEKGTRRVSLIPVSLADRQ